MNKKISVCIKILVPLFIICISLFFALVKNKKLKEIINKKERIIYQYSNELSHIKEIDYEKSITFGMLICDNELSPSAPFKDKKAIQQVIENRMKITGRSFYQESIAEQQFSSFDKGPTINKYNIPYYAKCLQSAIEVISKNDLKEFKKVDFYHAYGITPHWKKSFTEATRTDLHIFYIGDKGYKKAKIPKQKLKNKLKNELTKQNKKSIVSVANQIKEINKKLQE